MKDKTDVTSMHHYIIKNQFPLNQNQSRHKSNALAADLTKVLLVPLPAFIMATAVLILTESFLSIHVILLPQLFILKHLIGTSDAQKLFMSFWVSL